MPFVSVFFHFIIDLGLFCGTTGQCDICFLNFTYARVCIFIFRCPWCPVVPIVRWLVCIHDMRVRVHKNHYLTAMVNYARSSIDFPNFFKTSDELLWESLYAYNASNWWGAGIRYSLDTKIGPLEFDISSSNISKSVNLYFSLGYFF